MKKNNIEIKSKTKDLTILIPTLNEEFTIERLINEIIKKMKNTKIKYCIMITDNNSKDKTIEIASKKKDVLINICKKPGYGANLISGIKRIRSKYTIFFDADGSYNPSYIKILYNEINDIIFIESDTVTQLEYNDTELGEIKARFQFFGFTKNGQSQKCGEFRDFLKQNDQFE